MLLRVFGAGDLVPGVGGCSENLVLLVLNRTFVILSANLVLSSK